MNLPVIVVGGGGHAKVLIDCLLALKMSVLGFTDCNLESADRHILGVRLLGSDNIILQHSPESVLLVNGIGTVGRTDKRKGIYEHFKKLGYGFTSVVHPSSVVSRDVAVSEGAQIMAGAVVQPGSHIGSNSIINTKASVDHDCLIGDHVHLAPGVTLSGMVRVGGGTHIGTGAIVIQGVKIGQNTIVAAGALVVKDVPAGCTAAGVPAQVSCT